MADFALFYSWQLDLCPHLTKHLIRSATRQALKRVQADAEVEDAPRIDHDTLGVSGVPEIAGTIFAKIEQCGIFLADLSLVGTITTHDRRQKRTPNPNVLFELGYALAKVGWERVILVMNKAFGEPDDLIFDLKNRRHPITFSCDSRAGAKVAAASLSREIEVAIRACIQSEYAASRDAIAKLDPGCVRWMIDVGAAPGFTVEAARTMGETLAKIGSYASLSRMLDLGLIRTNMASNMGTHGFAWTHLGKRVIRDLNLPLKDWPTN
jgi:hypothetical protein